MVQTLLKKARKGTRVNNLPGNYDEALRRYIGVHFAGVEVRQDAVHTTADGRRLLVLNGDLFDSIVRYAKWAALPGDLPYQFALPRKHSALSRLPMPCH